MKCRIVDLRNKEVINNRNGCRIGFVDDVEVDTKTAKICAIVVFGRPKFFGMLGKCSDFIIPWENIELIGEDTILVNYAVQKITKK